MYTPTVCTQVIGDAINPHNRKNGRHCNIFKGLNVQHVLCSQPFTIDHLLTRQSLKGAGWHGDRATTALVLLGMGELQCERIKAKGVLMCA
jgi:hypothetical protein